MAKLLACFGVSLLVLLCADAARVRAENLPVTVERYTQACTKVGGELTNGLGSGGSGIIKCLWPTRRDGTECKVGSYQVNRCGIRCSTDACYAANPDKNQPTWPLNGGPSRKFNMSPTLTPGTLAPAN